MYYTIHGILQARILEWVAVSFSRGSSQPRDQTKVSHIAGRFFNQLLPGKQKSHNIKHTILTIFNYSLVSLSMFTLLCNSHHHPSPEFFTFLNWNSVPIKHQLPVPPPHLPPNPRHLWAPGSYQRTFWLYEFDYSRYLVQVQSNSICQMVLITPSTADCWSDCKYSFIETIPQAFKVIPPSPVSAL